MRQNVRLRYQNIHHVYERNLWYLLWIQVRDSDRLTHIDSLLTKWLVWVNPHSVFHHTETNFFCQHCGGKRGASHGEQWSSCSSASTGCALTCGFMRLRAFLFYSFGVTEILFHGFLVNLTTIIIPVIEYENNHIRQEGDLLKIKQSYRCRLFFY